VHFATKQWNTGKELDGRMTVKFTLTDPAEARAWAAWLSDRSMENDQAKKSATIARAAPPREAL
jgi:hypothetical protein